MSDTNNNNNADFTIVANGNYVSSTYEAPVLFSVVGSILEQIVVGREVDTPNSILAFVSGDRSEQVEYIEGLVGIGIFLSCLVSIWFITLLFFKCQGRDRVGCAAGYAFHDADSDKESLAEERRNRSAASGMLFRGDSQDVSIGAAVGDDDSVAMDEPARRESHRKSAQKLSSRLSSMFGSKNKTRQQLATDDNLQQQQLSPRPSHPKSKPPLVSIGGGGGGRTWSVVHNHHYENDYPDENCTYDSKNLEEIEMHMDLDNIVQSATQDSDTKSNKKGDGKSWTLQSLPKTIHIGDETDDEAINKNETQVEENKKKVWGQTCCCSFQPHNVSRRKSQTRVVFAFFAIVSLVCCALLVTHMYTPLESAALTSGDVVQETSQIVDELNEVLEVIDGAASATVLIMKTTPLQYDVLCPNIAVIDFQTQFGFNPNSIIETISTEYQNYIPTIVELLNTAKETGASVANVLQDVNEAVSTTNEYLWIIPLVICVTMLIIFSQLALMIAVIYKERTNKDIATEVPKIENCYGWTILPLQTIVVLVSWLLVIAFCFGIIVTTDSCMPYISSSTAGMGMSSTNTTTAGNGIGESVGVKIDIAIESITSGRGTPEDTVLAVLDQYIVTGEGGSDDTSSFIDDLANQRLSTYITGCQGAMSDPLAEVIIIQSLLQESLKNVDTQTSFANDVLGLESIESQCGASNQVRLFFDNLTVLNDQFADVNKAIKQAYDALSCPRVNTLYVQAVHGALCTDFATANANGLILLIVISFCGMILITLRAAWRSAA